MINFKITKKNRKNQRTIEFQISKSLQMITIKEERKRAQAVIQAYHYQH
jgi:hypothetical protein